MAIFKNFLAATALFNVALSSTDFSSNVGSVVTSIQLVTSVTFVDPVPTSSSTHCNTLTVTASGPPSTVTVTAPPVVSGTGVKTATESSSTKDMTIQTSIPSSLSSKTETPLPSESCISDVHTVTHGGTHTTTITGCMTSSGFAIPPPTLTKSMTSTKSVIETVVVPSSSAATPEISVPMITESSAKPSEHSRHVPSGFSTPSHSFHYNNTMTATATGTGRPSASMTKPVLPPFTDAADASNVGAALLAGGVLMALFGA
ncbi:hypothetical protein J4E93_003640 [Alternaria ventricosa]|uniref:uncharacterized protein n=1 Tax=Alternaria ventricosa TaxID=1187951 RepID=UPI0020C3E1BB|nr:uncharacterized protein J4E93_003640 [Alternaria ventricosa]KAI4649324.1 hypothetical protein J4E93_003640 [Alternaria ventricosa]